MSAYWLDAVVGNIKVEQGDDYVLFSGFRVKPFLKEMKRIFKTTRFESGLVRSPTGFSFRIYHFFAYDFYQLLELMVEHRTTYYNPEVVIQLVKEMAKIPLIAKTKATYPSRLDRTQLKRMAFSPLPSQERFFEVYDQKTQQYGLNGYILASPPGTGKTYMSLALQAMLKVDVVIVFSPSNALETVWKDTIETKMDKTDAYVYPGPVEMGKTHYVFNHDNLKYALEHINRICKGKKVGIIVDECHNFNELSSDRTLMLVEVCKRSGSKDILFMSGTPFKALGREVIPFLMATDPYFGKKEEEGFKKIFGVSGTSALYILAARIGRILYKVDKGDVVQNKVTTFEVKVKVPGGERFTLPEISKAMASFVVERVKHYKKDMHLYVQTYMLIVKRFETTLYTKKEHEELALYRARVETIRKAGFLREVAEEMKLVNLYERKVIVPALSPADKATFRDVKSIYKYLALKIQGEALGRILGRERTACNQALVEHIDNGKIFCEELDMKGDDWALMDIFQMSKTKVVMFTDFIQVLQTTEKVLKEKGLKPALVYGETNKDLTSIIQGFEKDPKVNPIVATYKSLSTAVPLIMADTCVLLNVPYRDYVYLQSISRVDRLGQKHPVKIFQYFLDTGDVPNISTRSKELMEWSRAMVDNLLGIDTYGTDPEVVEEEFLSSFKEAFGSILNKTFKDW